MPWGEWQQNVPFGFLRETRSSFNLHYAAILNLAEALGLGWGGEHGQPLLALESPVKASKAQLQSVLEDLKELKPYPWFLVSTDWVSQQQIPCGYLGPISDNRIHYILNVNNSLNHL